MRLQVLGCSGGIGQGLRTTALRLDEDVLLDAGTGVGELALEDLARIRHVFLTHAHLDHVASIPLLVDSIFDRIAEPVQVHALPETLEVLRRHVFNWALWPDFTRLPTRARPVLRLLPMRHGEVVELGGRRIEMLPVRHSVPAAGLRIEAGGRVLAFSGDTGPSEAFWEALDAGPALDVLIVECAFPDRDRALAEQAGHYVPRALAADLARLRHRPRILLTHLKPGEEARIVEEVRAALPGRAVEPLRAGSLLHL
ncbi:MBL fold metallo-hydrolase [Inmirania thermothiophila]|uniref:Beta-lactamase family protein n=1 Tax=Inmirania thermothiophila TaxID=1750597 RepID=A0A3N1Y8K6_9GAMM|nr:3',5'-cyclic-nucleotide phosphodiesterase [Inmirania thermothiophila]ROR35105.1 beta-lactamase family protein [Inmirania thermothiophila]